MQKKKSIADARQTNQEELKQEHTIDQINFMGSKTLRIETQHDTILHERRENILSEDFPEMQPSNINEDFKVRIIKVSKKEDNERQFQDKKKSKKTTFNYKRYSDSLNKMPTKIKENLRRRSTLIRTIDNSGANLFIEAKNILTRPSMNCTICINWFEADKIIAFGRCQHYFCSPCLIEYIRYKLSVIEQPLCPSQHCDDLLHQNSEGFKSLPQLLQKKFIRNQVSIQAAKDANLKVCPNQTCEKGMVKLQENKEGYNVAKCLECQNKCCFLCLYPPHKGQCDRSGAKYLEKNLKFRQCSQCLQVIEKKEGCNHITCTCKYEFCYECGKKWNGNDHICLPVVDFQEIQMRQRNLKYYCFKVLMIMAFIILTVLGILWAILGIALLIIIITLVSVLAVIVETENACFVMIAVFIFPIALYYGIRWLMKHDFFTKYTDYIYLRVFHAYQEFVAQYICN